MSIEIGSWVWLPDEKDYVIPGQVLSFIPQKTGKFRLQNGTERKLQGGELETLQTLDPQCLDSTISNLIGLSNLSENALLHNLRIRFNSDEIYTFVSSILIAVNPFRQLPLYGVEILERYKSTSDKSSLPPHIFSVADDAYKSMLNDNISQSVVISGESGAGKTESTKLILQFLAELSSSGSALGSDKSASIQQQILQCNPVMEAFGNAKTVRNNNSSRFGKLITIRYEYGAIRGASIISYLLEKSRVVHQQDLERNYHFFYQIVAAAADNAEVAKLLFFTDNDEHHYISQSSVSVIEGLSDLEQFNEVQTAMEVLGMTADQQMQVLKIVAGILHLGNIQFKSTDTSGDSAAEIDNIETLDYITALLGFDKSETKRCLTSRNIGSRSIITCPYTPSQATDARDALAKKIYASLFDWLIETINISLSGHSSPNQIFIAVLDIFGFEAFQHNSFEQLCINYCNEKLQYHFNNHIFMMEQAEYLREGVPVAEIKFEDNQPTLDLLEMKVTGIFSMIDEEISVPKGSDESLLSKIFQKHQSHKSLQRAKAKLHRNVQECFVVVHYAGEVAYNVSGFLEKNKDSLSPDLEELGRSSSNSFISDFFLGKEDSNSLISDRPKSVNMRSPRKVKTLGSQFKLQLTTLMETLNFTEPHFIRCMKPNMEKVGRKYDSHVMLFQLRYAGFLEVCRIRQLGYPNRLSFEKFTKLYSILAANAETPSDILSNLLSNKILFPGQCIVGRTKMFLKHSITTKLDGLRDQIYFGFAARIQKYIRGILQRARFRLLKVTLNNLKNGIKSRNLIALEDAIAASVEFPNEGINIPIVKEAKSLLKRLKEESKINKLLEEAITERQILALETAIRTAKNMQPPLQSTQLTQAIQILDVVKEEKALLAEGSTLLKSKNLPQLESWLYSAQKYQLYGNDIYKSIQFIVDRLQEESNVLQEIQAAIESQNLQILTAYLAKAIEMGLVDSPEIINAKKQQNKMEDQVSGQKILEVALENPHLESLQSALQKAKTYGVPASAPLMAAAQRTCDLLGQVKSFEDSFKRALDKRNIEEIRREINRAEALQTVCRNDSVLSRHSVEIHGLDAAYALMNTQDAKDKSYEEELLVKIEHAVHTHDIAYLRPLVAEAKGLGLTHDRKHESLLREADRIVLKSRQAMEIDMNLVAAIKMKDLDALNKAISNAQASDATPASLTAALAVRAELLQQSDVTNRLQAAIKSKNIEAIRDAVKEAESRGISSRHVDDGKQILDREDLQRELEKELSETSNQQLLSSALEKSIQYGITSDAVELARVRYEQLKENHTIIDEIRFAIKNVELLRSTEDGIREADILPLQELLKTLGDSGDSLTLDMKKVLNEGNQTLKRSQKQIEIQASLLELNDSSLLVVVKKLLRSAADLGMKNFKGFITASIILKTLENTVSGKEEVVNEEDMEGFNRMKEELYNEARQPNYHFANYINLRTAEDFAKGTILNKRKIMEAFLKHQKSPINRSLTNLDNIANSEAIIAFKSLLGYCGDKAVSFPASQGLDFVMLGIKKTYIRNELYLQAIKQTINSPSPYTQCRAFHLLCLLCDVFTPTSDFYYYVVNFFLSHTDKVVANVDPTPIQQMSAYCLARLQALKMLPLEKHLLDIPVETVEAYSARLPTIAPLYTPNGELLGELLVAPDVGIERLLNIACNLLHIHENRSGILGLYVVTTKSSDLAPMVLLPDHDFFIGDICQPPLLQKYGRPIKYFVKRKILEASSLEKFSLPFNDGDRETITERHALMDLTFQQLAGRIKSDEIRVLDESLVAYLSALHLAVDAQFRPGNVAIALHQGCMNYISESNRENHPEEYWGALVAQELYKCVDKSDHQLKETYVQLVSSQPFGDMHTYLCLKGNNTTANSFTVTLSDEIFLGLNESGIHFYDAAGCENTPPLLNLRYLDLKSFAVKLNAIRLVVEMGNGANYQIELITPLNEEISQYCLLYRPVQQIETQYTRPRPAPSLNKRPSNPGMLSRLQKLSHVTRK